MPVFSWKKSRAPFTGDGDTTLQQQGQLLVFLSPRASDAGLYQCVATNAAGSSQRSVKVVVQRPPVIMEPPPKLAAVPAGSPVTLPCMASGWPRPDIEWQLGGRPLPASAQHGRLADGSLRLAAVTAELAGNYSCLAKNTLGTDTAHVIVTAQPAPAAPTAAAAAAAFVAGPGRLRVVAGRPAVLCRLTGVRPERHLVRLTRAGQPVSTERLLLRGAAAAAAAGAAGGDGDGADGVVTLRLPAARDTDAGRYTCALIDHTSGQMWKQQLQLEVDNGWGLWSDCSVSCGSGVRVRNRDCQQFMPCQETVACLLPECAPRLRAGRGSVHGRVNAVPITSGHVITNVEADGRLESVLAGIEEQLTPALVPLLPLLTPMPWLAARPAGRAESGYQLTGGLFRKQTDVMFPTGEKLTITHHGLGVDSNGTLQYNTEVQGRLPALPEGVEVQPAQFKGDLVQTGLGDLYSHSTQYYQAGGTLVPFAVNETVTYDDGRGQMRDLVQSLDIENTDLRHDDTENRVLFRMTSQIESKSDECPDGFSETLHGRVSYCSDVDECESSPCSHECINIVSSFRCECPAGFTVGRDRRTCQDVDECSWGMAGCGDGARCENTPGSYNCVRRCGPGLRQATGAAGCYDIDECAGSPSPCDQLCHNTRGNFSCDCYSGYQLVDGRRCVDIDECNQMLGACSHSCINIPGSYRCACPAGLRLLSNGKCTDIDECVTRTHNCYYDELCVNTAGSFKCVRPCGRGYRLLPSGVCADIDECTRMLDRCHYSQQCRNLDGSYRCVCPSGFRSDGPGFPCTDINECSIAGTCQHNCTNMDGGYQCSCPSGFRLNPNKRTCDDIDECVENGVQCAADHACFNQRGSYSCADVSCPPGHRREPGTSRCRLPCRRRSQCVAGTWYAEVLSYKLLALPAGVEAGQDVLELTPSQPAPQRPAARRSVLFSLGRAAEGAARLFAVRQRDSRGVLYTRQRLPAGAKYRLHIEVYTTSRQHGRRQPRWTKQTTFVVIIAVSKYPY